MKITVTCYGMLADITGQTTLEFQLSGTSDELQQQLISRFPQLATIPFRVAVNEALISTSCDLHENDRIALLPPFSGG